MSETHATWILLLKFILFYYVLIEAEFPYLGVPKALTERIDLVYQILLERTPCFICLTQSLSSTKGDKQTQDDLSILGFS